MSTHRLFPAVHNIHTSIDASAEGLDSISHAFTRLGMQQDNRSVLSPKEASLAVSVEVPECIPYTYHHCQWKEGDPDSHLFELMFTATVDNPSMINRTFYGGSFIYFVSFGQTISSPPISPSRTDLSLGGVYIHVDKKATYISAWQLVLRNSDHAANVHFWKNVSASYIANSGVIRHPTQGDYVLHCHYTVRPQYIKSAMQLKYKKDEVSMKNTLAQVAADTHERLHRLKATTDRNGKSRAMDVDIVE